jgi:hypothetical protein
VKIVPNCIQPSTLVSIPIYYRYFHPPQLVRQNLQTTMGDLTASPLNKSLGQLNRQFWKYVHC